MAAISIIWIPKTSCGTARFDHGIATYGGLGYIIGGRTDLSSYASSNSIESYTPSTDLWASKSTMLAARYSMGCAENSDGKIRIFGGKDATGVRSTTTYAYNIGADTWATEGANSLALDAHVAIDRTGFGEIYIIGGRYGTSKSTVSSFVQIYRPTYQTFTFTTSMPTARYAMAAAYLNDTIYVIGGFGTGSVAIKTVEAYEPSTEVWVSKPDLPIAVYGHSCFVFNNKIYVVGGIYSGDEGLIQEYDPSTETWTILTDTMLTHRKYGRSVNISGKGYVIGGYNYAATTVLSTNEQFDIGATIQSDTQIIPSTSTLSSAASIKSTNTSTLSSTAYIVRTSYASVVSPGSTMPATVKYIVANVAGAPVATIQSNAVIDLYSNSLQTTVIDTITSSTDPLYVLDLASVTPPLGYQNYDWAYDWVTRTYNQAKCVFEARSSNTLTDLTNQPFRIISQGQIIPRADIRRYHQYKAHVWASGSRDFELHQFTIKAYVDFPAYPYARTLAPQIKTSISSITLGTPVDQPDIIL